MRHTNPTVIVTAEPLLVGIILYLGQHWADAAKNTCMRRKGFFKLKKNVTKSALFFSVKVFEGGSNKNGVKKRIYDRKNGANITVV